MYRLLVVDDEPYIVDSISAMLRDMNEFELDVYPAYSAFEALKMLEQRKFDIVLSDIQMPGMDGLEMQRKINALWSRCKLIFLTGYDQFEYIQSAMKQGASNYILKTDGSEEIKQALRRIVHQIDHELENNEILHRAKKQFSLAAPMLKKDLLTLLSNEESTLRFRSKKFNELELALDANERLICVVGQVDRWKDDIVQLDRALLLYAVQNIADELLSEGVLFESVVYDDSRFAWFMQPRASESLERVRLFVEENIDAIQRNCRSLLQLTISVAIHRELIEWEDLPEVSIGLQRLLFRGLGRHKEMVLYLESGDVEQADSRQWKVRGDLNKFANVIKEFESGDSQSFCECLQDWMDSFMLRDDNVFTEAYYMAATFLMSCMNRLTTEGNGISYDLKRLSSLDSHRSREDACLYLLNTAKQILEKEEEEQERSSEAVVRMLDKYMEQNLGSDLSLIHLAEIAHFNPQYLSRLYKQVTGIGISDRILELRLAEARRLLDNTNKKIQEIAIHVGFQSAPYFTRFFKKKTNLTPQEYRNKNLIQ